MSVSVQISARAEADLAHQLRWYQDHAGADTGDRFLAAFDDSVHRLVEHPEMGKRRRFRARELSGMRSPAIRRPFSVHLIFHRIEDGVLSIERVMHGARDLPHRLLEPPG